MPRYTDYDGDEERLPEGFKRIGYDADTQTYTFEDADGNLWESEEGNRYGKLWRVGEPRPSSSPAETAAHNAAIKAQNRESVRMMLPFVLLVLAFLGLVFRVLNTGGGGDTGTASKTGEDAQQANVQCADGFRKVGVEKGQSCWEFAEMSGLGVEEWLGVQGNEGVDCGVLKVGRGVCVKEEEE